jgi:hypothetical protein
MSFDIGFFPCGIILFWCGGASVVANEDDVGLVDVGKLINPVNYTNEKTYKQVG